MKNVSDFNRQRKNLSDATDTFLRQNFSPSPKPIKVLIDHDLVVIRVDNFLCPAEIEMGKEKLGEQPAQKFPEEWGTKAVLPEKYRAV